MKIAIVGGGINGLCCAVQIKEKLSNADVTIISEQFTPNTTGDGSAGLWGPYLMGNTPEKKVYEWSLGMHNFLKKLWLSSDGGDAGVCLIPLIRVTTVDENLNDFWKDIVYGCKKLEQAELDAINATRDKKFKCGLRFITFTSEPVKLLPYLAKTFQSAGGKIVTKKIVDLNDFIRNSEYNVVINCAGLGARLLVNDKLVYPIRGQVVRVKANWIYHVILDESDDGNYIIPNVDTVVLGGTHQENNYDVNVCPNDKQCIMSGCASILPGLQNAEHLFDWVGLRPGRSQVRLELEVIDNNKMIIHNYGHGGSGVTLAWGCASEVLQLLLAANKSKL